MSIDQVSSSSYLALLAAINNTTTTSSSRTTTSSTATTSAAPSGTPTSRVPGHITAAAEVLGLSTDDVQQALAGGSSLADLAEQQGVSRDDLVSALVAAAPADIQSSDDVEDMVGSLVDQKGLAGPAGPPPGGSSGVWGETLTSSQQDTLDSLSSLLGTSSSSLLGQLYSGTSLSDLLSDGGVSLKDLAGVVQDGLLIDTQA